MRPVEVTNETLVVMLERIQEELTVTELFAYESYFAPRNSPDNLQHPCVYFPDNPAFSYQQDASYRRLLTAIHRVETLSGAIRAWL